MIKKIILLLVSLFVAIIQNFGQSSCLYFIAGRGSGDIYIEDDKSYPVDLLMMENNRLQKILDLASNESPVLKIASYNKYKKVIINKKDKEDQMFLLIDYSKPNFKIDTIRTTIGNHSILREGFYLLDKDRPYIAIPYRPKNEEGIYKNYYYGIDMQTFNDTIFDEKIIRFMHTEGAQGLTLVGYSILEEGMEVKAKIKNDTLAFFISPPKLDVVDTVYFNIPNIGSLKRKSKHINFATGEGHRSCPIINKSIIAMCSDYRIENDSLNYGFRLFVYDSDTNIWTSNWFPGTAVEKIRLFENWIVGNSTYTMKGSYKAKIKKYGSIPGLKYRSQESIYGFTFDKIYEIQENYPNGVLYLYNVKTFKYIEFDALEDGDRQGDSEILLIKGEKVYYRINDKIYENEIINGEKLGTPKLLVKDSSVPAIHWAFIAG